MNQSKSSVDLATECGPLVLFEEIFPGHKRGSQLETVTPIDTHYFLSL